MQLREIQDVFKNTILDPAQINSDNGRFRSLFAEGPGVSLENRIKVYRNNVIRSLTEVAMAALPMTRKLAGEKFLEQAMRAYVISNLPTKAALTHYGRSFPEFIRDYEPAKALPYLYDLTRLEWAWEAAYYAADDKALPPAALAGVAEEDLPYLTFSFRQSFALIESEHPLDQIVDFCRAGEAQEIFELSNRGSRLLIFRPDLKVEMRRLDEPEYNFLHCLYKGQTIQQAAETILQNHPNINLTELLQKYLSLGIFAGYDVRR